MGSFGSNKPPSGFLSIYKHSPKLQKSCCNLRVPTACRELAMPPHTHTHTHTPALNFTTKFNMGMAKKLYFPKNSLSPNPGSAPIVEPPDADGDLS